MSRETAGAGLSPPRMISEEMLDDSGAGSRIDFERGMRYSAPATLALIAACFAVFLWQCGAGVLDNDAALVEGGALVRDRLLLGEVWRLASSMFLHGGFAHLVGNMIPLFILGMACEHAFGPVRMVAIYLAAGLAGGIATLKAA